MNDRVTAGRLARVETEVRRLAADLSRLWWLSPEAWFVLDADAAIVAFNHGYLDLFEITAEQARDRSHAYWRDRVVPEDLAKLDRVAGRVFLAQSNLDTRFRVACAGLIVPVVARADPLTDGTGAFTGWAGSMAPHWSQAVVADPEEVWEPPPLTPWGDWPARQRRTNGD